MNYIMDFIIKQNHGVGSHIGLMKIGLLIFTISPSKEVGYLIIMIKIQIIFENIEMVDIGDLLINLFKD